MAMPWFVSESPGAYADLLRQVSFKEISVGEIEVVPVQEASRPGAGRIEVGKALGKRAPALGKRDGTSQSPSRPRSRRNLLPLRLSRTTRPCFTFPGAHCRRKAAVLVY